MRALIFLLLFFAGYAQAADVGYELEVIIFEDTTGVYDYAESWLSLSPDKRAGQEMPASNSGIAKKKKSAAKKPQHKFLEASQYRLSGQAGRLAKNPDFRILVHTAWKQPGLDRDLAFAVPIDSTATSKAHSKVSEQAIKTKLESFIKGEITLIMSRYLHVNAELDYFRTKPKAALIFTDQDQAVVEEKSSYDKYPILFERRMRSREVHYIDHPLVGMIVLATPYKIETEADKEQPAKTYKTL
jgi:hypothetical protein